MKFLDKLESRLQIPQINITYYLIGLQILAFLIIRFYPNTSYFFELRGDLLYQGQWWRIITFIMLPLSLNTISAALSWYMYYVLGTAIEKHWLTFRYLIYLMIPYIGTIVCALIFPTTTFGNSLIFTSVFLAFTTLFPHVTVMLFFIIPIKVKWLGVIAWIGIVGMLISSRFPIQVSVVVSILNYFLFFGRDIIDTFQDQAHHTSHKIRQDITAHIPHHICSVCGKNEISDPYMGIRYCTKCIPEKCFCEEDFAKHSHIIN